MQAIKARELWGFVRKTDDKVLREMVRGHMKEHGGIARGSLTASVLGLLFELI